MPESHVVSALVDKRAELAGQTVRVEQQLGQFRADLIHVDATIRLFAPILEPETIRAKVIRRPDGWFEPGEVKRRVLDTLRRSAQPMAAPEVVRDFSGPPQPRRSKRDRALGFPARSSSRGASCCGAAGTFP